MPEAWAIHPHLLGLAAGGQASYPRASKRHYLPVLRSLKPTCSDKLQFECYSISLH